MIKIGDRIPEVVIPVGYLQQMVLMQNGNI